MVDAGGMGFLVLTLGDVGKATLLVDNGGRDSAHGEAACEVAVVPAIDCPVGRSPVLHLGGGGKMRK